MKTQHFGIEIELTGITRSKAASLMATFFGTERKYHEGGAYDTYIAEDGQGRKWKAMNDSSLYPEKKVGGRTVEASTNYRTEVVSPILSYDDIPSLQELIRTLRRAGAFANSSCGIHIHVGAERFTPKTLRNLVNVFYSKEDLIYRALSIDPGREHRYCRKTNAQFLKELNKKRPATMAKFADLWYMEAPYGRNMHYNSSRYHGLNLHATFTKGTVEFRLFNGTLHAGEIKAYIQFCLAMTHQALTQKKASARKTETDNEKYAFRCWMLRLGLIGDEFKTCRHHLLKNLTGNAAWRHAAA
jgi:hypothetical protein